MRPSDGAYVLFEGVVRNHHEGKAVESIFYDAYRPMAEKEIAKIVDDVRNAYAEVAIDVVHRLGQLIVGDSSISSVSAPPQPPRASLGCRRLVPPTRATLRTWTADRRPGGEEWVGWQGKC